MPIWKWNDAAHDGCYSHVGHKTLFQRLIESFSTLDSVEARDLMQVSLNRDVHPVITKHEIQSSTDLHAMPVICCTMDERDPEDGDRNVERDEAAAARKF